MQGGPDDTGCATPFVSESRVKTLVWLLPVLAFSCFAIGVRNEAIGDDLPLLVRLDGFSLTELPKLFFEGYWAPETRTGLYRPLMLSAVGVQQTLFGTESLLGFHLVSYALHAACTWLVFRVLAPLVGSSTAWLAALFFALHPIHAEAVVTLYGQAELLATFFGLLALERALAAEREGGDLKNLIVACVCYALALLSKEGAVVILPIFWWIAALFLRSTRPPGLRRWFGAAEIGFAAVLVIYLVLRVHALEELFVPDEQTVLRGQGGLRIIVVSLGSYLRMLIAPVKQVIYYGHLRDALVGVPWSSLAWLAAAILLIAWVGSRRPGAAFWVGLGWMGLGLAPVANVVPIGIIAAERVLYLPSVGFVLLMALTLAWFGQNAKGKRLVIPLCLALVISYAALSARTAWRWRTPYSLWKSTVEFYPASPKAHAAYGMEILAVARMAGQAELGVALPKAEEEFRRALQLNDHSSTAFMGLGLIALMRSDCQSALPLLRQAASIATDDRTIHQLMQPCLKREDGERQ
jgi:hypothetical protein